MTFAEESLGFTDTLDFVRHSPTALTRSLEIGGKEDNVISIKGSSPVSNDIYN